MEKKTSNETPEASEAIHGAEVNKGDVVWYSEDGAVFEVEVLDVKKRPSDVDKNGKSCDNEGISYKLKSTGKVLSTSYFPILGEFEVWHVTNPTFAAYRVFHFATDPFNERMLHMTPELLSKVRKSVATAIELEEKETALEAKALEAKEAKIKKVDTKKTPRKKVKKPSKKRK